GDRTPSAGRASSGDRPPSGTTDAGTGRPCPPAWSEGSADDAETGRTVPRAAVAAGPTGRRAVPDRRILGLLGGRGANAPVATAPLAPGPVPQDQVVLRVQDHGPGIPAEEARRVFTRFYRLDRSRARSTGGGSGLGLAIVASVARAHGGEARVLATPGGGTTVEITLPVEGPPAGMETSDEIPPTAV
ncbi:MAG: ATP-binding protein, partial [Actinomycetaceae bacterium]